MYAICLLFRMRAVLCLPKMIGNMICQSRASHCPTSKQRTAYFIVISISESQKLRQLRVQIDFALIAMQIEWTEWLSLCTCRGRVVRIPRCESNNTMQEHAAGTTGIMPICFFADKDSIEIKISRAPLRPISRRWELRSSNAEQPSE